MCGICGVLALPAPAEERRRRVADMTAALEHRGPDDRGRYGDDDIEIGFRRLSVIDLETGQQPVRLEDDRAVLVLNGEIYNFRELRRELESRHAFRSHGDAEVVLRLYAEEGVDAISRLNGMFALAIWDRTRRTLLLARDRFGVKPLYYTRLGATFAFASEVGALLAGGFPGDTSLDPLELRHYLSWRYLSPQGSILRHVRSVPPATILEVTPSGVRQRRFWRPPRRPLPPTDHPEETLRLTVAAAVRRQLVADVPVGVFLSGGVDSATVASLAAANVTPPLATFSVGFSGDGSASELPAAAAVARALGSSHHEIVMDPREVAADLPAIAAALDGPLGDPTAIPTWYMSRLARRHVTVALSGEGADELFGGYPRQRYDVVLDRIGPAGRAALPHALRLRRRPVPARLLRRLAMPPGLERQLDWSRLFSAGEIDDLVLDPLPADDEMAALHADAASRWRETARFDPVNARLEGDLATFLPGDLLPKVDRMSMGCSLEVRVPYLDNEVADLVLALPGSLKVSATADKRILRRMARRVAPRAAARRRKQGFEVPIGPWLRGPLLEALGDTLSPAAVRRRGRWNVHAVARLLDDHLSGRSDNGAKLWTILAFELWLDAAMPQATRSRR